MDPGHLHPLVVSRDEAGRCDIGAINDSPGGAMSASAPYTPGTYSADPAEPVVSPVALVDSAERSAFWLALAASVTGIVIGVMMIAWPTATLRIVAILFGLWLLIDGVVRVARAMTGGGRDGAERALLGVVGLFFIGAGVVALRNLLLSLTLIVTLIGLMWLIGGVLEVISAVGGARGPYRVWNAAMGALSIIAGIVVLAWPDLSLTTLVYVTGIWLIVMGLIQAGLVLVARRVSDAVRT
jgi:hypothetical protein